MGQGGFCAGGGAVVGAGGVLAGGAARVVRGLPLGFWVTLGRFVRAIVGNAEAEPEATGEAERLVVGATTRGGASEGTPLDTVVSP